MLDDVDGQHRADGSVGDRLETLRDSGDSGVDSAGAKMGHGPFVDVEAEGDHSRLATGEQELTAAAADIDGRLILPGQLDVFAYIDFSAQSVLEPPIQKVSRSLLAARRSPTHGEFPASPPR